MLPFLVKDCRYVTRYVTRERERASSFPYTRAVLCNYIKLTALHYFVTSGSRLY